MSERLILNIKKYDITFCHFAIFTIFADIYKINMEYPLLDSNTFSSLAEAILYEDNHLLIVNKKAGDISQADKTGDIAITDKYKAFIAQRDNKPGKVYMGLPHRLDRPVSGILILCKTSKSLERMSKLFRESEVHKTYYALVYKAPQPAESLLENWLLRNEKMNKSFVCQANTKNAKLAKLIYKQIGNSKTFTLLEVKLLTGRHHQIRCQLANIGCIIKGDLKYGAPRSNKNAGICLHAQHIDFIHPIKKTPISLELAPPSDWPESYIQ